MNNRRLTAQRRAGNVWKGQRSGARCEYDASTPMARANRPETIAFIGWHWNAASGGEMQKCILREGNLITRSLVSARADQERGSSVSGGLLMFLSVPRQCARKIPLSIRYVSITRYSEITNNSL